MKVLSKPELDGNILLLELEQIMANIVLTEQQDDQMEPLDDE